MKSRVVITGLGLVTPLGSNPDSVWNDLCQGKSGITFSADEQHSAFRSRISGRCTEFNPEKYLPHKDVKKYDPFAQFALGAAVDAVEQSGLDFSKEDPFRCASIIGSGVGGLNELEMNFGKLFEKGPSRVSPFTIPKLMLNAASAYVSIKYGLLGPSYGVATACASASNAIADAARYIRDGELDVVVAGGSEAVVTRLGIAGFCAMHALSERNDEPQRASRPFDKDRDGFVLSEGCGMIVLESLEHAKSRSANILGEFLGYGLTSDGIHITQPDEVGKGAARAMQNAICNAGLNLEQIGYINAHGTSTTLGDIAETNAVKQLFGDLAYKIPISSTKSQIGHLLGGSGGVELIFSLYAIRNGVIPPTINLETPDPLCDLDYTPLQAREAKFDYAVSNSFGFGGHNASLVIGRYDGT
ncbi:MAG: beta-ketoacyl-ACP synthase II [Planctomycetaceae bacterium]|jgi:3-oxoacyl-[acyl-carrier-protein] synthase II|nr:beta-ketoacyl-ACP synthase II [Planctomycetaceae bacterium]